MVNYNGTSTLDQTCRKKTKSRDITVDTEKRLKKGWYKVQVDILYFFINVSLYADYSFFIKCSCKLAVFDECSYVKNLES